VDGDVGALVGWLVGWTTAGRLVAAGGDGAGPQPTSSKSSKASRPAGVNKLHKTIF
jgi:hypothetical protein